MNKVSTKLIVVLIVAGMTLFAPLRVLPQTGGTARYVYDENGRLHAVIAPSGQAVVYDYDTAGNFIAIRRLAADDIALLGFSPRAGLPGDRVSIIGVGFSGGVSAVSFNGVPAQIIAVSPPIVIAEVPQGATTGPLTISTSHGSATTDRPFIVRGLIVGPSTIKVLSGQRTQFTATVILEGDQTVRWGVDNVVGGGQNVGTITDSGLYTAPILPSSQASNTYTIRATSVVLPALFGQALVTVLNPDFIRELFGSSVSIVYGNGASNLVPGNAAVSVLYGPPPGTTALGAGVSIRNGGDASAIRGGDISVTTGPTISTVAPAQITRGSMASVTITGQNLAGITTIQFIDASGQSDASIGTSNLSVNANGTVLTVTVVVNSNVAVGRRFIVVSNASLHSAIADIGTNALEIVQ